MFQVTDTTSVVVINRKVEFNKEVVILLLACAAIEAACEDDLYEGEKELMHKLIPYLILDQDYIILNEDELKIILRWAETGCENITGEEYDTLFTIKKYLRDLGL